MLGTWTLKLTLELALLVKPWLLAFAAPLPCADPSITLCLHFLYCKMELRIIQYLPHCDEN